MSVPKSLSPPLRQDHRTMKFFEYFRACACVWRIVISLAAGHVTMLHPSLNSVHFKGALNSGEAQPPKSLVSPRHWPETGLRDVTS